MSKALENTKVAFLAANGFEQVELTRPWEALKDAGADVELISLENGEITGVNNDVAWGDSFTVDHTVDSVSADSYDALVLPGGLMNPDLLRVNEQAVQFVRDFFEQHKPVAAICHGPWTLIEAGVVSGRRLTSYPSLKTDLQNAGATWEDRSVVCDSGLVTSRTPEDLDDFCAKVIEEIAEGRHRKQTA